MTQGSFSVDEPVDEQDDVEGSGSGRRTGVALLVSLVVLLAVGGVVVVGALTLLGDVFDGGAEDYAGPGTGEVSVVVEEGQTVTALADDLVAADVVASREALLEAARGDERADGLQPGTYLLQEQMSAAGALDALVGDAASQVLERVTVPEGFTALQISERIAEQTHLEPAEVEAALADVEALGLPDYAEGDPEGFLFPATYEVQPTDTATDVLAAMVDRFEAEADALGIANFDAPDGLDLGPHEVVTTASLVQAEARQPEDFGPTARVVYNRLAEPMLLQFDSTINYARSLRGERDTENLTFEDLEEDGPYNSYSAEGLPPTPIGSPGRAALQAALDPPQGDWLFFITVDEAGNNLYNDNFQQHVRLRPCAERGRAGEDVDCSDLGQDF